MKTNKFIGLTNPQSAHGDYDHMGESINLVENFKVENVILALNDRNWRLLKWLILNKNVTFNVYCP